MTFLPKIGLPKSAETRRDLLDLAIGLPLTLAGTAFLILLAAAGSFVAL